MVLSTDIAHCLGDAFGVELGPEPTEIAPNLWGQESDVYHNVDGTGAGSRSTPPACCAGAAWTR